MDFSRLAPPLDLWAVFDRPANGQALNLYIHTPDKLFFMMTNFPVYFSLKDGTDVAVIQFDPGRYSFHLTRLNSEKHNFVWIEKTDQIEESYETRFDQLQLEAVSVFKTMLKSS